MREYLLPDGRKSATPQHSTDGLYDKRAFSVLEEAMGIGCLPSFKPGSEGFIELRGIPPAIAEVLVLKVLAAVAESQSRSGLGKLSCILCFRHNTAYKWASSTLCTFLHAKINLLMVCYVHFSSCKDQSAHGLL
jgi:hypothetical protein